MKNSSNKDVANYKEAIVGLQGDQYGTTFMDALRLAHMLQSRAMGDIESKAKALGASEASIEKLKEDVLKLAAATPIDRFLVSTTCMRVSNYLLEGMPAYFKNTRAGLGRKESVLKSIVSVGEKSKANKTIKLGSGFEVNSNVPVIIFGKRKDLDIVTNYLLDRAAIESSVCLHFSLKNYNKRLNKFYKKIRPEDWSDKLRVKEDLHSFLLSSGKYRPVDLILVEDLCNGFNPDKVKKVERLGSLQEAFYCFKKAKLHTANKGICTICMYDTDNMDSKNEERSMKGFYDIGNVLDCSSDGVVTYLTDSTGDTVLKIKN